MSAQLPAPEQTEPERVIAWRRQVLQEAGYPLVMANRLAHDLNLDLHRTAGLLEHGCPLNVARRILAN